MPTRPVENPQRPGMGGGGITGLGDYPAFEGMGEWGAGDWAGTASETPWDIPESIPDDWRGDDWSMNFRPGNIEGAYGGYQDWAEGAGQEALPLDRFNDAQYAQAFGGLPDAPGPGADPAGLTEAGYGLQFYPGQTANQDWRLQYGITDPEGDPTGYALSGGDPYGGFPWVSGDQSFVRQEEYNLPDNTNTIGGVPDDLVMDTMIGAPPLGNEVDKTLDYDPNREAGTILDENVGPQTDQQWDQLMGLLSGLLPARGDIADAESTMPLQPPSFNDLTRKAWGQDALSQMQLSRLGHIMESGGLEETNLQRRTDQAMQQIIDQGGVGGENLSPLGLRTGNALQQIIAQGGIGAENLSPLGETTANTIEDLLASGGRLPADVQRRAMEMETLRDPIEAFRQAQLAQGQATMADRGLLGQGPELDYMQRLESQMAPMYAGAGQQVALGEAERADQRYRDALAQGGDLAAEQARLREGRLSTALTTGEQLSGAQAQRRENRLADTMRTATAENQARTRAAIDAARASTEYREFLTDSAFQDLDRSMEWNEFLYRAGMERAEALEMIQTGRLQPLLALVNAYMGGAQSLAGGFTGFPFLETPK